MDGDGGPLVLEDQPALERIVEFAAEHGIEIAVPIARCSGACTRLVAGRPSPFLLACRARRNWRRVIHGVLTLLDPSLTLTRTQYPAIVGNRGNRKPFAYAGFANPCNAQQPLTAHS